MEKLSVFILIVWHFAFFWRFYRNPNLMATSEVLSNFFPHWLWMGRHLRKGKLPLTDRIYYRYPACIPFLSTFYPPVLIMAFLSSFLSIRKSFRLYTLTILFHYLLSSILSLILSMQYFSGPICILGALSLTCNAYNIKIYTPCFAYTSCWIMGCLIHGWLGAFCFGMAILSGYWPILVTFSPLLILSYTSLWGVIIGLPQIIPFLWYYPKSCRAKTAPSRDWGRMPLKRYFVNLSWPENGVHYPELSFGVGICSILWIFHPTHWLFFALIGFLGASGIFVIARIPARFNYLTSFSMIMASLFAIRDTSSVVPMIILQCFLLWKWRYQYPHFPFCQWWKRKVELSIYTGKDWPNNTGYMKEEHHQDYFGGFALAENYHE